LGVAVAIAVVYVIVARIGLMIGAVSGFATLVWPATGIALAALLILGRGFWPAIMVGAFVANLSAGAPLAVAFSISVGNTLEAVLAVLALRAIAGFRPGLDRLIDALGLLVFAALLSTLVSASIGVASLKVGGLVPSSRLFETWRAWWLGDMVGDLVVAPMLLVWTAAPRAQLSGKRWLELSALATLVALVGLLVYGAPGASRPMLVGHVYMFFPLLLWSMLRFGQRVAVSTTFAIAGLAIWGTALSHGPFVQATLSDSLVALQTFMAVVAATCLVLGASVAERGRLAADLQEAVQARDAFIAIAAHELRTPLSALQLQVQSLGRASAPGKADDLPETTKAKLALIDRQVSRLGKLIDSLLDVSRVRAGKLQIELEELDLAAVVRDVVARAGDEARRAGCSIELRADRAVSGQWDALRLDQIVTNLLSNAMKYGSGKPVEVLVEEDQDRARIVVSDHGIGVAPSDHERIFERFERLLSERHVGGFGLGLWIARAAVQAMGGTIHVESRLGEGATFVVELPRRLSVTPPPRSAEVIDAPKTRSVLVVDDDGDILQSVTELLVAEGYQARGATNGQEALEYLHREAAPALILLDLMMPTMNGWQFLDQRAREPALAAVPVVLLSANVQLEEHAKSLAVDGFVRKPLTADDLLATVERYCPHPAEPVLRDPAHLR
jgi:signal transduction histidine kinase/CheY-like chemotaxis protein